MLILQKILFGLIVIVGIELLVLFAVSLITILFYKDKPSDFAKFLDVIGRSICQ